MSRTILLVMTREFERSDWCLEEFKASNMQRIKTRGAKVRDNGKKSGRGRRGEVKSRLLIKNLPLIVQLPFIPEAFKTCNLRKLFIYVFFTI